MPEQAATSSAAIDRLVGGKYRIVRAIASGGMGSVHEAVHVRTQGRVALKILSDDAKRDESSRTRFAREARAAGQLRSRHVARVLDVDALEDGTPYLVMELLEGRDLSREVKERGPLPVADAAAILVQVAAGLAEAHAAGIVHRDLKPGNVYLAEEGAQRVAKVLDFGISKVPTDDTEELTRTFATVGTPAYMSPEQIRSPRDVSAATDVWSFGVTLYRVLAGRVPFSGNSSSVAVSICHDTPPPLGEIRDDVPPPILAVLDAMLERDPSRRPTIREVAAVLIDHVEGSPSASVAREAFAELSGLPPEPPRAHVDAPALERSRSASALTPPIVAAVVPEPIEPPARPSRAPLFASLGVAALLVVAVGIAWAVGAGSRANDSAAPAPATPSGTPSAWAPASAVTTSVEPAASSAAPTSSAPAPSTTTSPSTNVVGPPKTSSSATAPKPTSNGLDSANVPARL